MKRGRLSDSIDLTDEERLEMKKFQLLAFPIFSIVLGIAALAPPLFLITNDRELSFMAYIPLIFGVLLLLNGIKQFARNKKDISKLYGKKKK